MLPGGALQSLEIVLLHRLRQSNPPTLDPSILSNRILFRHVSAALRNRETISALRLLSTSRRWPRYKEDQKHTLVSLGSLCRGGEGEYVPLGTYSPHVGEDTTTLEGLDYQGESRTVEDTMDDMQ